ncbi:ATPase, partial [Streptomyces sp. NPDC049577]
ALRAHDGRAGGSRALLARLEAVLGPAQELPGKLYPRADRTAVLASFAPEVGRCAASDPVAAGILRAAARHIAETAAAVCPRPAAGTAGAARGTDMALTGGLTRIGAPLLDPLHRELQLQLPYARLAEARGDPLDGASHVAGALLTDSLRLPVDDVMLRVIC